MSLQIAYATLLIALGVQFQPTAFGSTNWNEIRLSPEKSLSSVCSGAGLFVAVGKGGLIMKSADGLHWGVCDSPTTNNLRQAGFTPKGFVVAGDNGTILSSENGVNWTTRPFPFPNADFTDATISYFNDSIHVYSNAAATQDATTATDYANSDWRAQWTADQLTVTKISHLPSRGFLGARVTKAFITNHLANIVYTSFSGDILTSQDSLNWTPLRPLDNDVAIKSAGPDFFLNGLPLPPESSALGESLFANDLTAIAYGSGVYCIAQWNTCILTKDFFQYRLAETYASTNRFLKLISSAYLDGYFVFVGGDTIVSTGKIFPRLAFPPLILTNPNGKSVTIGDSLSLTGKAVGFPPITIQWLKDDSPIQGATNKIYQIPSMRESEAGIYRFDAQNEGGKTSSRNAIVNAAERWQKRDVTQAAPYSTAFLAAGTNIFAFDRPTLFKSNTFIRAGWQLGAIDRREGTSGVWTNVRAGGDYAIHCGALYGDNFYFAGESGKIFTSKDGNVWGIINSGVPQNLFAIASDPSFIAVGGSHGTLLTSKDGQHWLSEYTGFNGRITAITATPNSIAVIVDAKEIYIRAGLGGWRSGSPGTTNYLNNIAYNRGVFMAAAADRLIISMDGISWRAKRISLPPSAVLVNVFTSENRFLAAASNSGDTLVFESEPIPEMPYFQNISWPRVAVASGGTASFSAPVFDQPVGYRWIKGGIPLSAQTNAILVLNNCSSSDEGEYFLEVAFPAGVTHLGPYVLAVIPTTPQIRSAKLGTGRLGVRVDFAPGTAVRVDASSALQDGSWLSLTNFLGDSPGIFTVPLETRSNDFFRAFSLPKF